LEKAGNKYSRAESESGEYYEVLADGDLSLGDGEGHAFTLVSLKKLLEARR